MLYIINSDIKENSRTEAFSQQLSEVGEYLYYMPKCYFLKTGDSISASDIYKRLKATLIDEDLFLLAPVKMSELNGWLSSNVVDWLKNNN